MALTANNGPSLSKTYKAAEAEEPDPQTPMQQTIASLETTVVNTTSLVRELANRLVSVRVIPTPKDDSTCVDSKEEDRSDLEKSIYAADRDLRNANDDLRYILATLRL